MSRIEFPTQGLSKDAILKQLESKAEGDVDYQGGRTWSLVYWVDDEHHAVCEAAQRQYMDTNALNPMAFKSLKDMEHEVVQMTADMLNGPPGTVGTMTSGGTESLLMAIKTYRDLARKKRPWVLRPNMVVPASIHAAFDKGSHYFGVKKRVVPMLSDGRVDVRAMEKAIDRNTILLACSAPQYPWGTIDPVEEIGALAQRKKLPLHVDACFGGFILPFLEKIGVPMAPWDFRVPGVTSVSADIHKYGYAPKGSSVILYRDMSYLRHQFFVAAGWTGGIYISPSMLGTRSGGAIASAWASMKRLGEEGYVALARDVWKAAELLREGIEKIDGLKLLGRPDASIVTWASDSPEVDVFAIADKLAAKGWSVDRQQDPPSIHLTVNAVNLPVIPTYLEDLAQAVEEVRAEPELSRQGEAAVYGLMAKIPVKGLVAREVTKVMEGIYAASGEEAPLEPDEKMQDLVERFGEPIFEAITKLRNFRDRLRYGKRS